MVEPSSSRCVMMIEDAEVACAKASVQRKSLIGSLVEAKLADGNKYAPSIDAADFPSEPIEDRTRSTVFSSFIEHKLSELNPEAHETLTKTFWGQALQAMLLAGAVFAYVGNPILGTWTKTVGVKPEPVGGSYKVTTYCEVFLIFLMKVSIVIFGIIAALVMDWKAGAGFTNLKKCFNVDDLKMWSWVALGWTVADVAEQMVAGRLDPATYTVLSQSRLVGTAIVMRSALGIQRTTLQWTILCCLSLVIIMWKLTPNDFSAIQTAKSPAGLTDMYVGLASTIVKMTLSIACGVFGQSIFQKGSAGVPFLIVECQICLVSTLWLAVLMPLLLFILQPYVLATPWWDDVHGFYGMFGGEPMCVEWGEYNVDTERFEPCKRSELTGWDYRTVILLLFNIYRDYATNFILLIFDALIKNLCNAVATAVSYYTAVFILADIPYNTVKGIGSVVITMQIAQYGLAQAVPQNK